MSHILFNFYIMKKIICFSTFLYCCVGIAQVDPMPYEKEIKENDLRNLLYVYASDYFEGRDTGSEGQRRATAFLRHYYQSRQIEAAEGTEDYFQNMNLFIKGDSVATQNVAAIVRGSEKADEYIILSSHLDHVGMKDGKIYNGADDDGSGTVAMLEIADAFQKAKAAGHGPKRSVVFLHVSGEEKGLLGSKYYTENPLYPLDQTITNLNVDMIGRLDPKRENPNPNYIYLIGSDKLSQELHDVSEQINSKYCKIELDYTYNDDADPNRFYYRSDHYNFAKNNIPIIFYFNGTHDDYHKHTDTPDKINYDILQNRTRLIFHTAWELANREKRISLNK